MEHFEHAGHLSVGASFVLTWPNDKRLGKGWAEHRQTATERDWHNFSPRDAEEMVDVATVRAWKTPLRNGSSWQAF